MIDISSFDEKTGAQLLAAASHYGFLYISTRNTGFTPQLVSHQFAISKQTFSLPQSELQRCQIDSTNRGWTGMHGEILDPAHQTRGDFKEAFNIGEFTSTDDGDKKPQQPLPAPLSSNLDQLAAFEARCVEVCNRVLDLLGLGLQVREAAFFSSRHTKPSGCTVRLLHYPALPAGSDYRPEVDVRAGAHSDYGSCTLLFQRVGQPGLEIRTPEGGWASVPVIPDGYECERRDEHDSGDDDDDDEEDARLPPILVNMGDLLSYWTNGLLKSTVHRVIFPAETKSPAAGHDRYSIAYFCHPANDTKLVAVPSETVEARRLAADEEIGYGGGAVKGEDARTLTAREHLVNRLEATYGFRMNKG